MSSSPGTNSPNRKTSLADFIQSTVPLSLLAQCNQEGSDEMSRHPEHRVLSVTPSPSQQGAQHPLFGAGATGSGHPNSKSPQELAQYLRAVSRDSTFDPNIEGPAVPNLQPRQPTSSGQTYQGGRPSSGDLDVISMQEVLKQLDKQAESRKRYTLQMDYWSQLTQNLSWEEVAEDACHLWHERETREACYLNETQFCQDQKLLQQKRQKVRCSACKVLVHTGCIRQLYYEGVFCKPTCREIKQKVKDTNVVHHFLKRRKMGGKCATCGRGFGNWKNFSGRTFEGFSCSWCGDAYHLGCFSEKLRDERCHMGPLRNVIIPPSWIIKLPQIEPEPTDTGGTTASGGASATNTSKRKRTSKRRTKRRVSNSEERPSKYFAVKPLASSHNKPVLVFINPKSGGNEGAKLMQTFQWLLNPRQIFDLSRGGPKFGLQMFKNCANLRILACGGDGTAGWVLSILDQLDIRPFPPVSVLPLGTGNDLARVLNWGAAYGDEPLDNILMHVEDGPIVEMDRWMLSVWPNPEVKNWADLDGKDDVPIHVINNYFSIGADAQVSLDFHESREANPQKFNNRFKNKFFYSKLAGQDLVTRKFANLTDHVKLVGDGIDLTSIIRQQRLEAICFLNINSYGAGNNAWGTPPPGTVSGAFKIGPQALNDGLIEIVGFWASTFPKLLMGAHGERIAQCQHIKLYTFVSLPVQIDGEACKLKPSIIEVVLQNKALMIRKEPLRTLQAPLRGVSASHQLKVSVSKVTFEQYNGLHSDLNEIRKIAVPLGFVVTTPGETLHTLRPQIHKFTSGREYDKQQLSKNWQYLDVASNGRLDRMFQVLPEQEESISVGDMLSDGILIVEHETPPCSPAGLILEITDLDKPNICEGKTQSLGRSASYAIAVSSDTSDSELTSDQKIDHTEGIHQTSKTKLIVEVNGDKGSLSSTPPKSPESGHLEDVGLEGGDTDLAASQSVLSSLPIIDLSDSQEDEEDSDNGMAMGALQKSLFDAVKRGKVDKIMEAHRNGARLANVDQNGLTPLHHAARLGRKDVVQYLVDNIPKDALDLQDEDKAQTALHKAAWYGYRGICKILVEAGASLMRTDYQGNTPYLKSIESEDVKLQEYLKVKEREQLSKLESQEVAV